MIEPIKIDGLAQFSRNLRKLNGDLPKALRLALNEATDLVVNEAERRIPSRTGRARKSIKAKSTRTQSRIAGGSNRVPYFGWLDFGGRRGRESKVSRVYRKEGRYLYAAYFDKQREFDAALTKGLLTVAQQAGIEVD
jgi:hypothetical protein